MVKLMVKDFEIINYEWFRGAFFQLKFWIFLKKANKQI